MSASDLEETAAQGEATAASGWKKRPLSRFRPAGDPKTLLITNADTPVGHKLVKRAFYEPGIRAIEAVGRGPVPRAFDAFIHHSDGRLRYRELSLVYPRDASDLFLAEDGSPKVVDQVVHLPRHGVSPREARDPQREAARLSAEARVVLARCLETRCVTQLVALGTAYVYRLAPGNANLLDENSDLELDPRVPTHLRAWIECDRIFASELENEKLAVSLLRIPTVVSAKGELYFSPFLTDASGPWLRSMGFDPLCALVSEQDVTRAVILALRAGRRGPFNIAGREVVPLSELARWAGHASLPVPTALPRVFTRTLQWALGADRQLPVECPQLRHGFSLDTRHALEELGFAPQYRISLARGNSRGPQVETTLA